MLTLLFAFIAVSFVSTETISGVPYQRGSLDPFGPFSRRIEFQTITVDDLDIALDFYVGVLGASLVDFCNVTSGSPYCSKNGASRIFGNQHFDAMFEFERQTGANVPHIGDSGAYVVESIFLVFGNGLVQLVKFSSVSDGTAYPMREPMTSPCFISATHMCFWIDDDIDMNDFIYAVENVTSNMGLSNVAWNRPVPQETRDDRKKVPKNKYANKVTSGAFEGQEWSYFKGPLGEQLELYKITDPMKDAIAMSYCNRGAVSNAFTNRTQNLHKYLPTTKKITGIFQFGFRTDDLHAAVGFYTEVLGGDLIPYPTHGINIRGDENHWMILANETIVSYEQARILGTSREEQMMKLGVANLSSSGGMRLDHRFILFDNYVVEPLLYTNGFSFGGKTFNPRWNHAASPGFIGSISAAFDIPDYLSLPEALVQLKKKTKERGFPDVFIPSHYAQFNSDHPYSGFEYSYGRGISGEIISYVKIGGRFQKILELSFQKAGAVSTMWQSTNVFQSGAMNSFCNV